MYHWIEIKYRIYYSVMSLLSMFIVGSFYKKKFLIFIILPLIKSNCTHFIQFSQTTDLFYGWLLANLMYSFFFSAVFQYYQFAAFILRGKTRYEFKIYNIFNFYVLCIGLTFLYMHTKIAKYLIYYFLDFTIFLETKNLFVFFPNFFQWVLMECKLLSFLALLFTVVNMYLLFYDNNQVNVAYLTKKYTKKFIINFILLIFINLFVPIEIFSLLFFLCVNYLSIESYFFYKCCISTTQNGRNLNYKSSTVFIKMVVVYHI